MPQTALSATSTTTDYLRASLCRPALQALALLCALVTTACLPGKRDNTPLDIGDLAKTEAGGADLGASETVDAALDGKSADGLDASDVTGPEVAPDAAPEIMPDGIDPELPVALGGCTTDTQCSNLPFGPCNTGICNQENGLCYAKDLPDDTTCVGDNCTTGAKCSGGKCAGAAKSCDDKNSCTSDACNPSIGCVHATLHGIGCDDDAKCTEADFCVKGACLGKQKNCDDGNVCSHDVCDPATGACAGLPLPKDNTVVCSNPEKACQGAGQCDGTKNCVTKNKCDDGNACTDDLCGVGDECLHLGKTSACTPQGASDDPCNPGTCTWPEDGVGMPTCVTKAKCEGKLCNQTVCNKTGLCSYTKLETGACDDGDPCTADSSCNKGQCKPGTSVSCDDGNPCTTEACAPELGCVATPATGAAACNDGDGCTSSDACASGKCAGKLVVWDDGNPCTKDTCDPAVGCKHVANDDGAACPGGACKGGQCVK